MQCIMITIALAILASYTYTTIAIANFANFVLSHSISFVIRVYVLVVLVTCFYITIHITFDCGFSF